jgi:hypothetical protein
MSFVLIVDMKTMYITIWRIQKLTYNNKKKEDNKSNKRRKMKISRYTTLLFIQPFQEDE